MIDAIVGGIEMNKRALRLEKKFEFKRAFRIGIL